jgi:hypothetical protein
VRYALFFFLVLSNVVFGQMLDNRYGTAFTDKPFFNVDFIRENKVHKLNGKFTYKKPGDMMRETQYMYVYEFDSLGRLNTSFETRKDDGTVDTTWNVYVYNETNQLIEHKRGDGKGFTSTGYEYDEKGNQTKESYIREYIDSLGIAQRTVLNSETMKYEYYDLQVKKTVYNNYELPYKYEIIKYNELGYLVEREERLIMTMSITTIKYTYNDKGYIASISSFEGSNIIPTEEFLYIYDDYGNLLEKHLYRNGVFTTEFVMIYNEKSKLLSYVLTRDVATNFIMILGLKDYEFFN